MSGAEIISHIRQNMSQDNFLDFASDLLAHTIDSAQSLVIVKKYDDCGHSNCVSALNVFLQQVIKQMKPIEDEEQEVPDHNDSSNSPI